MFFIRETNNIINKVCLYNLQFIITSTAYFPPAYKWIYYIQVILIVIFIILVLGDYSNIF